MLVIGLCYFVLALFDAWYTNKRMPQVGLEAEMNPVIRFLSRKFGNHIGIYLGVLLPTLFLIPLGLRFHWVLIYLLGCRSTLAAFQIKVLKKENATNRATTEGISGRGSGLPEGAALLQAARLLRAVEEESEHKAS